MTTYIQIHIRYVIPAVGLFLLIYWPLLGRRDAIKIWFLMFMATLWTTPWDNWIISHSAWSYPPSSLLGRIHLVPLEEHLFFLLQPALLVLIHCVVGLRRMVPFRWKGIVQDAIKREGRGDGVVLEKELEVKPREVLVQTLPRRPVAAAMWLLVTFLGFLGLFTPYNPSQPFHPSHLLPSLLNLSLQTSHLFYLSAILIWISPVISFLTYLGASLSTTEDWVAWVMGTGWLCWVDGVAIRAGAWGINGERIVGWEVIEGLPVEEALFFALVSYLLVLASSLISHLHFLHFLSPHSPPPSCPPSSPLSHISLLISLALNPPPLDLTTLLALSQAERTLQAASKSFDLAKMGWGREVRVGLVGVYGWCRVTDDLIDEVEEGEGKKDGREVREKQKEMLGMMRRFLEVAYGGAGEKTAGVDRFIQTEVPKPARLSFYLFGKLIPHLIPQTPFNDLLDGYDMDLKFPIKAEAIVSEHETFVRAERDQAATPIHDQEDLILYADRVAGSVADMILHLTWNVLTDESVTPQTGWKLDEARRRTLVMGRKMGQALQLVNIARDIRQDAVKLGRVYIPRDWLVGFGQDGKVAEESEATAVYARRLLQLADELRAESVAEIENLPRTARAGTRAMVASYFEIAEEIRRRRGHLPDPGEGRLRVSKGKRLRAVVKAAVFGLERGVARSGDGEQSTRRRRNV